METKAYQLKVTLRHTKPPIWRRLEVRGDTTLGHLHDVLQVAMGWTDSHLHQFVVDGAIYGTPDPDWDVDVKNEARVRLDEVLRKPKDALVYEYDFGDGWEHTVVLEKVLPREPGRHRYPVVTAGRRACPPEDCGGVHGFYRMLEILGDPAHPEHEEMLEWTGDEYDPTHFDRDETNRVLRGG